MRAVVTRVKNARVEIEGTVNGAIGTGFLVLLGVGPEDTQGLFPPYCVAFSCNTQSIPAKTRLVWRKNPSSPRHLRL